MLWWGLVSPSPAGNAEMTRMVVEKQMAALDSVFAMQAEFFKAAFVPWWGWTAEAHAQRRTTCSRRRSAPRRGA